MKVSPYDVVRPSGAGDVEGANDNPGGGAYRGFLLTPTRPRLRHVSKYTGHHGVVVETQLRLRCKLLQESLHKINERGQKDAADEARATNEGDWGWNTSGGVMIVVANLPSVVDPIGGKMEILRRRTMVKSLGCGLSAMRAFTSFLCTADTVIDGVRNVAPMSAVSWTAAGTRHLDPRESS